MSLRTTLALGAAAIALGFAGATGPASAQEACQERIAQLEGQFEAPMTGAEGEATTGTAAEDLTAAPGSGTTAAETAEGAAATADGAVAPTMADLQVQFEEARMLCDQGQEEQANQILAQIEADMAAAGMPHLDPAAGTGGGGTDTGLTGTGTDADTGATGTTGTDTTQ